MSGGKIAHPEGVPGSVTDWLGQLRHAGSDEHVHREIWNRYFQKLAVVARNHLSPKVRRTVDEEDIALSALNSFFEKVNAGRFPHLSDRAQLWSLLTRIATYKAINVGAMHNAQKRGGGNVRGDSIFAESSRLGDFANSDPGPQELAAFKEFVADLLKRLDPTMQKIAHDKLLGKSDAEIAEALDVSPRTVARKLTRIRTTWHSQLEFENQHE